VHPELFSQRNVHLEDHRFIHPKRHGGKPNVYGTPETIRLKHRVPEVTAITKKTQTRMKRKRTTTDQRKSNTQGTTAMGGRQEACITTGLCTLGGSPARQYLHSNSALAMRC